MPNYNGGATAKCPYYQHESRLAVSCEGILDDTIIQIRFANESDKEDHVKLICSSYNYLCQCPIARMLENEYKEDPL